MIGDIIILWNIYMIYRHLYDIFYFNGCISVPGLGGIGNIL